MSQMGLPRNCLWADADYFSHQMCREQLSCVHHRAAQMWLQCRRSAGGGTALKCHESQWLCLLWRHPERTFSQEEHTSSGEQEDPSQLQLSAKERRISKLNNKPPKPSFFLLKSSRRMWSLHHSINCSVNLCKSALRLRNWSQQVCS